MGHSFDVAFSLLLSVLLCEESEDDVEELHEVSFVGGKGKGEIRLFEVN